MNLILRTLAATSLSCVLYAAPEVTKVEPPNWWMGLSLKPVRLLVHGLGLTGARLQCYDGGLTISRVSVNQSGTYLFADVVIVRPGKHAVRVAAPSGNTKFDFEVLPAVSRTGRFQGFSPDDFVYLIMPDRFSNGDPTNDDPPISKGLFDRSKPRYYHGGDFQGIVDRLPYLKDLGVTTLWINPIYDNVNHLNYKETPEGEPVTDYHGYGAVDFYGVEEHFGDLAKFRKLVDAAHASGLKIILDMVENHTGPYHPWVADPPTPTWFHGTEKEHIKEAWQSWTLISPKSSPELQQATLDGWFGDFLPDLNQDDPETARYLIQNTLWWIAATGIDGIRQDTLIYVPRRFWRDWMAAIKRDFPHFRVVGEVFDGDPGVTSFFQGGKARFDNVDSGVDSVFDFPQYFAIRSAFAQGKPVEQLAAVVAHDYLYNDPADLVTFLGLHDVDRFMNEPGATYEGLQLALTFLMTSRGIPMIYYGDEIGMAGGKDPDNRRDFPGGWPGDAKNKFEPAGRSGEEHTVVSHIRRLADIRQRFPVLRRGALVQLAALDQMLAYARVDEAQSLITVINNDTKPGAVQIDAAAAHFHEGDQLRDLLGTGPNLSVVKGKFWVRLEQRSAALYARLEP